MDATFYNPKGLLARVLSVGPSRTGLRPTSQLSWAPSSSESASLPTPPRSWAPGALPGMLHLALGLASREHQDVYHRSPKQGGVSSLL